jgi:MFS family permease
MVLSAQSVFRSRSFRLFFSGQALSYTGDGLRTIAIPLLVYHLTKSASALGITYALEFLPFALFGLVGGSLADRLDRRRLMIATDFIRFAIMLGWVGAYSFGCLTLWMLYTGIAVMSLCAAVFQGGQASSIPYLLGKERATQAVAALTAVEQTAMMIGPPLGGAVFALVGPLPALVANAATYLCSQVSVALVETLGPEEPTGMPTWRAIAADIATGFHEFWADAAMRQLTLLGLCFNFFGLMTGAVLIPYLKVVFAASDTIVGVSLGLGAVGAVVGSLGAGRVPAAWPLGKLLPWAFSIDALLFVPVMFTHDLRVAIFFLALSNAVAMFEIAQIVGWRLRVIPEELVGRVFGAVRCVVLLGAAPGALLGGVLADRYGARVPIVLAGIGYIVVAGLVWCLAEVRRERR